MSRPLRLLSIAHSYAVGLNRRLAHEMAAVGNGRWEVTAVAPAYFHGGRDLRPVTASKRADEPIPVHLIEAHLTRIVHAFFYGSRLRQLMRDAWDFVHCWEEPFIVAGGQIARLCGRRVPFAFWTAQNLRKTYLPPFAQMERYCLDRCAGWMACGQTTLETQLGRGYGSRPHCIAPLGVDIDRFQPDKGARSELFRSLNWTQDGPPVVGYLGRFTPEKGVGVLMQALDLLQSPWRALIVGAGPMEAQIRAWASRYGERVKLCTPVVHDEVPRHLNGMDILAAPSLTTPRWREQFGRMLTEGFATGLAVIGSNSGEIPYVVADAGRIAAEGDASAWATEIGTLIDSPGQRAELGRRGRELACTRYAWPVVAGIHLDFFSRLLATSARA